MRQDFLCHDHEGLLLLNSDGSSVILVIMGAVLPEALTSILPVRLSDCKAPKPMRRILGCTNTPLPRT